MQGEEDQSSGKVDQSKDDPETTHEDGHLEDALGALCHSHKGTRRWKRWLEQPFWWSV